MNNNDDGCLLDAILLVAAAISIASIVAFFLIEVRPLL